eukprot:2214111-Lingulodinium_polyedra.AAC.1
MATPARRPSLGPCRAHDAAICMGMIPEAQHAKASLSQRVSCSNTTVPLLTASSMVALLANFCGDR